MERRTFNRNILTTLLALQFPMSSFSFQNKSKPVLIDADTANEVDDLYAIIRILLEPSLEVIGLNSAQWNHRLSPENTVFESQKLNEDLLRLLNITNIPTPMGAEMIMGKPWGGTSPSDSPAAQFIIKKAKETQKGEKLSIITLGAVTNLASAIALAPEIIPKIDCYALMGKYFPDRKVWDKDEFNLRHDLNAANFLFNTKDLSLHIMPINTLYNFKFDLEETLQKLSGKSAAWDFLANRWLSHSPEAKERIVWDLALVEAFLYPQWAKEEKVLTPPENEQKEIKVYTEIDHKAMLKDWWNFVEKN